jgi:PAS domain S-box-containing protein
MTDSNGFEGRPPWLPPSDERRSLLDSALSRAIIESAEDAIIAKSLDGMVATWNAGAERLFGYTAAEMIGRSITALFPADRVHEEGELIARLILGKTVSHSFTRRVRKDGVHLDVSVTLSPVRDSHGQIVAISSIAREVAAPQQRDIPDEKIDELVRNQQRFQTLVRLTSHIIWTTNPRGGITGAQPGWAAFTGQSFDDYQDSGWSACVHPEDAQATIEEWTRCVADRRPFLFEHRLRRHDGAYRTCTINAAPILNDDGSIREWVGVHNDITDRRQQEDALKAQQAKFRLLAESLPQFVWTCKPDGWMEYFNQRWFDYTGLTEAQSQGWGWGSVVHPDDVQHCVRSWNAALESGKEYEVEFRFLRASDGIYRWHLGRGVPLHDADGAIVKWLGTATDIEDYKATQARNLASQAELEDRVRQRTADLERVGKIAGVGGWSITVASGALSWSDETCRIHDVQPGHLPTFDEAVGYYAEASRNIIEAACRACTAHGEPFDLELQVTTAKGRGIWVRAVGEAQVEQGTVVRIFGAFQDITARKLAERELFDQHELLRITLESIGDAVITTDAQGRLQSLNPVATQLMGRSADECLGIPVAEVFDIFDAETQQRTLELMAQALSPDGRAATGVCTLLIARDGTEVPIEDSVAPIRDKSGNMVGTVVVFRDVTERKRAAHELLMANERFALAADAAGIGVWEWDLSGNMLRWDDQMYRLYGQGATAGEEPYARWITSLHAEDRGRAQREIDEALDGGKFDTEFRIVLPSGDIRHLKSAAQIQHDGAGVAIRMIGINFDISARKQAELDLKSTSSLLRRVLDSANDLAIIATAPDLTISVFNKGAERLLGYTGAELIGSATAVAFHDAAEIEARALELSTLLGRPVQGAGVLIDVTTLDVPREWTFIRKDQRRVPVLLNISAMVDDSGALTGYLGVARDITRDRERDRHLQEAKSEAERANAAKSDFLSNMSHEIRTPLNAVIGLGYLLEQTPLNGEQRAYTQKINFAGHSLLEVINDILDLSKIEAGEMLIEDVELDLKGLIQAIGQMLTPSAHAKGLALLMHFSDELPARVCGDAARLGQIATNLLSNAIKFTETGQVDLELSCSNSTDTGITIRLSVRDTGIGMDEKGLARLFRPFSQADTSTSRRFGGTGLGLSITRHLVDMMGGEIGVSSTMDVGSEFWVNLPLRVPTAANPLIDRAPAPSPESARGARSLARVKILVVDDSDINCEVAQHILRGQGATVATSATGAGALERLRQNPTAFDIVLMDVQMPDMDGNETARRIRTELHIATLPIIALTAGALLSERERSLQAGMNDFLTKPFEPAALIGLVHRHLKGDTIASLPIGPLEQLEGPAPCTNAPSQIDLMIARDVFGDDTALFVSLLARLVRDFSEFAVPVSVEPDDATALSHLSGRLHKLAGGAGMIGATTVHRLAAAAEAALAAGQAPQMIETLLQQLAAALTSLGEEVAPMLAAATVTHPASTGTLAAPIDATPQSIDRLLEFLDAQNMDAMEHLSALSASLRTRLGEARFGHLQDAVTELNFSVAAAILRDSSDGAAPLEAGKPRR